MFVLSPLLFFCTHSQVHYRSSCRFSIFALFLSLVSHPCCKLNAKELFKIKQTKRRQGRLLQQSHRDVDPQWLTSWHHLQIKVLASSPAVASVTFTTSLFFRLIAILVYLFIYTHLVSFCSDSYTFLKQMLTALFIYCSILVWGRAYFSEHRHIPVAGLQVAQVSRSVRLCCRMVGNSQICLQNRTQTDRS